MNTGNWCLTIVLAFLLGILAGVELPSREDAAREQAAYTEGSDEGYREGFTDCEVEYGHADGGAR